MRFKFLFKSSSLFILMMLAGCDQQSNQVAQLSESFQRRIDEKDKLLAAAQGSEAAMRTRIGELEGASAALKEELQKAQASGLTADKLAAVITPIVKKAIQESELQRGPAPVSTSPVGPVRAPQNDPGLSPVRPVVREREDMDLNAPNRGAAKRTPTPGSKQFNIDFDAAGGAAVRPGATDGRVRESQNDIRRGSDRP